MRKKLLFYLSELAIPVLLFLELILCVYIGYKSNFIAGIFRGLGIYLISAIILIPLDLFRIMIYEINHLDLFGPLPKD